MTPRARPHPLEFQPQLGQNTSWLYRTPFLITATAGPKQCSDDTRGYTAPLSNFSNSMPTKLEKHISFTDNPQRISHIVAIKLPVQTSAFSTFSSQRHSDGDFARFFISCGTFLLRNLDSNRDELPPENLPQIEFDPSSIGNPRTRMRKVACRPRQGMPRVLMPEGRPTQREPWA